MSGFPSFLTEKKSDHLDRPYCLAGRRCYLIGFQNGRFPPYGFHTIGEMGGIWAHPIKIADGYWLSVSHYPEGEQGYASNVRKWLKGCRDFTLGEGGSWAEHSYRTSGYRIVCRNFVPHEEPALGIEIRISADEAQPEYVYLGFLVRFHILPVWFSGWPDPAWIEAEIRDEGIVARAVSRHSVPVEYGQWAAALKFDPVPQGIVVGENLQGPEVFRAQGTSCLLRYRVSLKEEIPLRLTLAGDYRGEHYALDHAGKLLNDFEGAKRTKTDRYLRIVEKNTCFHCPEKLLNDAFSWAKLNLDWLIQESPILGEGAVAGYQDFPWYFGVDIELAAAALLMAGFHDEAKNSLEMLSKVGKEMKGRIPHEIVTNGNVYSWGHIMETTLFVRAVLDTYLWTGDEAFFDAMYHICRAGILDYVLAQPRVDGLILLEFQDRPDSLREKLCPSFVVFGLEALAEMARRRDDGEAHDKCAQQAVLMKNQIEELFWDEAAGLYATALDGKNKPIVHFPGGFWPLQSGSLEAAFCSVAEKERIDRALSRIEGPEYTSEWGLFLTADRNITMPITAGLAAIGELNYGRTDQGMEFLRLIAKTKGHMMPGGFPEYVHPSGDPEKYPHSSCFVQLWSAAMLIQGLLWGLLRPEPDIPRGELHVQPRLPTGWASVQVSRMRIGQSTYSFVIDDKGARFERLDGPQLNIISKED